ncbi:MAG: hypothetical protein ACR2GU_03665 [Rubrobacteraceae bacterium]
MGSARKILQTGSTSRQQQQPIPAEPKTKREGTKRITVDLPRDEHKFLRDYAYDNDTEGMRVMRALLMELAADPELSERVLRRLPDTDR